jgi:phosphate transport system permease protein
MAVSVDPASVASTDLHALDEPRVIDPGLARADRVFRQVARSIGLSMLVLILAIGAFIGYQAIPTLRAYGLDFFTESAWQPELNRIGVSGALVGTIEIALIALFFGIPFAWASALFISEYAPPKLKSALVSLVDLMAAIPGLVFGLWGFFLLQPHAIDLSRWLSQHLGWFPLFKVNTDADAAMWAQSRYTSSAFIAGIAVSMMVIPYACSVMRGVFAQAPIGEREAALALGATRWGVIRAVVLPFGRRGVIGGTMLALGRALGETVAVLLIISPTFEIKFNVIEVGTMTISALIAGRFGEASAGQLSALLAAGFVLFVLTLGVNAVAAVFVNRSRSGSITEA